MYFPDNHKIIGKRLLIVSGLGLVTYWVSSAVYTIVWRRKYADRRARKQEEKIKAKHKFSQYLAAHSMSAEEIESITSKPFMELVEALKSGELDRQKVLLAYQHKAFEVDKRLNCVVEFLYPDFSDVNLSGPFAGAPISIKDNLSVKGCESYAGMAYFLTGPANQDSVIVTVLKSLGAVPFVRTAVPQAMLSVLSSNPIDGTVLNPQDPKRSPAGSSSGEAALIGAGGSGLGFGTDLGGSIRLPAAMCNIVGFKPTPNRLSQRLMLTLGRYMTTYSCLGPLARDVDSCIAAMQAVWDSELHHSLDYFNPPLPYNLSLPQDRPLKIGYFTYDGSYMPVPAAQRAVIHVKEKLEALGHQLFPWSPPYRGEEWLTMYLTALYVDGGLPLWNMLKYDAIEPTMQAGLSLSKRGRLGRYIQAVLCKLFGQPEDACLIRALLSVHHIPSLTQHIRDLNAFRQRMYDHWKQSGLDAVICPAFGMAAPIPVHCNRKFTGMLSYLHLFNVNNMPAGCLPSGLRVTEADVNAMRESSGNYISRSSWHKSAYDLQMDSVGFPTSVQVAAAPWRDELCLHVMKLVQDAVKSN